MTKKEASASFFWYFLSHYRPKARIFFEKNQVLYLLAWHFLLDGLWLKQAQFIELNTFNTQSTLAQDTTLHPWAGLTLIMIGRWCAFCGIHRLQTAHVIGTLGDRAKRLDGIDLRIRRDSRRLTRSLGGSRLIHL
jgi:hypothetical protein